MKACVLLYMCVYTHPNCICVSKSIGSNSNETAVSHSSPEAFRSRLSDADGCLSTSMAVGVLLMTWPPTIPARALLQAFLIVAPQIFSPRPPRARFSFRDARASPASFQKSAINNQPFAASRARRFLNTNFQRRL